MAGEQLQAGLTLDLTELTARLQLVERQQQVVATQTQQTATKVEQVSVAQRQLDRLTDRLGDKVKSISKNLLKTGLQLTAATAFSEIEANSAVGFLSGLGGSAAVGAIFGGPAGAAAGATFYLFTKMTQQLTEVIREVATHSQRLRELDLKKREFYDKIEQRLLVEEAQRGEERREWLKRLEEEFRKKYQEQLYDTISALAQEQLALIGR